MIEYNDFAKNEMKVGKIVDVVRIPRTDKLYKIQVDMGVEKRQIVSSLVPYYSEEDLLGQVIIVLTNLKPTKFAGEESNGMLLCAETDDEKTCVLLTVGKDVPLGTKIT